MARSRRGDSIRYAGEVHGHRQLRHFVHTSQAFLAEHLVDVEPVASTRRRRARWSSCWRSCSSTAEPVSWPVAVVAESADDHSATFRTYGSQWPVVGHRPVRAPILDADPSAAPGGVVSRHLDALAAGDLDGVVQTFAPDGYLQEPIGADAVHRGTEAITRYFSDCFSAGGGIDARALPCDRRRCAVRARVQLRALGRPTECRRRRASRC